MALENRVQIMNLAAVAIMKQLYRFDNKEFKPKNVDDCEVKLEELIKKNWVSFDFCKSVAQSEFDGRAYYINLDKDWKWNWLSGSPGMTDKDFDKQLSLLLKKLNKGQVKVIYKKTPYGKNFFNKETR